MTDEDGKCFLSDHKIYNKYHDTTMTLPILHTVPTTSNNKDNNNNNTKQTITANNNNTHLVTSHVSTQETLALSCKVK